MWNRLRSRTCVESNGGGAFVFFFLPESLWSHNFLHQILRSLRGTSRTNCRPHERLLTALQDLPWPGSVCVFRPVNHVGGRTEIKQTNSGTTTQVCKDSKAVVKELTPPPSTPKSPNPTIATVSCKTCRHAIGWMCTEKGPTKTPLPESMWRQRYINTVIDDFSRNLENKQNIRNETQTNETNAWYCMKLREVQSDTLHRQFPLWVNFFWWG